MRKTILISLSLPLIVAICLARPPRPVTRRDSSGDSQGMREPSGHSQAMRKPSGLNNAARTLSGRSVYEDRPADPEAFYFTPGSTDGTADVTTDLQEAINTVKNTHNFGIVFIPEGKYLITRTIYIPRAVRLIGYGKNRPTIILAPHSPGFQIADTADKGQARYMIWFVNSLSSQPAPAQSAPAQPAPAQPAPAQPAPAQPVYDAGASTFYSALSNINLRIDQGNPAAVALRTHFAQHSFISHVDISIGDGKAGIFDVGNEIEDVRFFGGDYGIYTTKPSPGWPFMMVDAWFEGQRKAAIRTREAGLTIVRMTARRVPTVIDIDENYHEKLFMEDCRFEQVSGPAVIISNEGNASNQISLRNISCSQVPLLTLGRRTGKQTLGAGPEYTVRAYTEGLQMDDLQADPVYKTTVEIVPAPATRTPATPAPAAEKSDIPVLPPMDTWHNLRSLGAKGDGTTDDTKALQDAIDRYSVIYLPQGWYLVSETIRLKPNTVLIGLNPIATQIMLADNTPAFGGFGGPKPLLEAPQGGNNIVNGIGLSTASRNPRAVACKWMSGAGSYMNDVKFIGGHGGIDRPIKTDTSANPDASNTPHTTATALSTTAAPATATMPRVAPPSPADPSETWDTQYWSLWITNGGGGTFKDIWTANTSAGAGTYISNTSTSGRIYAMSVEHHVRNEIRFNQVSHWKVYDLQLEEESRESSECQPMELEACSHMVFANLYMFRVIRVNRVYPYSIRKWGGSDIEFLNVHNYSQTPYTTTDPLYDFNTNTEVRPWEFARLYIRESKALGQATARPAQDAVSPAPGGIQLLATGFDFAVGLCADSKGNVYFCDSRMRRIYQWSSSTRKLRLIADYHWQPLSLACDKNDSLLVVFKYVPWPGQQAGGKPEVYTNPPDAAGTSFSGWGNSGFGTLVYSVNPERPDESIRLLSKVPMEQIKTVYKALYPAHRWRDYHDFNTVVMNKAKECFVAPDSVTIIPVVYDLARSTSLAEAYPGRKVYISDEYDKRTVSLSVGKKGDLSDLAYFAEKGEFVSTADSAGNVYIADGEVYKYHPTGQQINIIKVPERPTALTSSGADTLYITGHHSLYSIIHQKQTNMDKEE